MSHLFQIHTSLKVGLKQEEMQAVAVLYGKEDITSLGKIPKLLLSRN